MYKLVIADDDEIQLMGMCRAFDWGELGVEVAAAVLDGDQALAAIEEKGADLLITDICMSNLDGLDLIEKLQENGSDVRVVIMSAYDNFKYAQRALQLGVTDYLLKPVDLAQMRETMIQILREMDAEREKVRHREEIEGRLNRNFNEQRAINRSLETQIAKLVLMENETLLHEALLELRENLRSAGGDSILILSFSLSSVLGAIRRKAEESGRGEVDVEEIYKKIIVQPTLDDAIDCFEAELAHVSNELAVAESLSVAKSVRKACRYIEEHYADAGLRIGEVAEYVGFSQSYFSSVFSAETGKSYSDYVIDLRMREAQSLLKGSDYKIQEICYMVGYDSPSYFSAAFKNYAGVSVSQYRKAARGQG